MRYVSEILICFNAHSISSTKTYFLLKLAFLFKESVALAQTTSQQYLHQFNPSIPISPWEGGRESNQSPPVSPSDTKAQSKLSKLEDGKSDIVRLPQETVYPPFSCVPALKSPHMLA